VVYIIIFIGIETWVIDVKRWIVVVIKWMIFGFDLLVCSGLVVELVGVILGLTLSAL